ncbi:M4 family metallopeptidase [Tenacibaculum amylolyticum]|uniref:M4 family metallopeptidase n=1 Tax=Tenacibaculum amylolyticum TaxID=104269 RepID=UPI0038B62D83
MSIYAQHGKGLKQIKLQKKSKTSLQKAPEILKKELRLSPNESLKKVKQEVDDLGITHEKFQQRFKGIKVEFATYTAHGKSGVLSGLNGRFYDVGKTNVEPKLSKEEAFQIALQHTNAEEYMWEYPDAAKEMNNYQKPEGELVIIPEEVIKTNTARLAYKFDIFAKKPVSRGYLYVDAHNGKVLLFNPIIKHADNFGHAGHTDHAGELTPHVNKLASKKSGIAFLQGLAETRYSGTRNIDARKDADDEYTLNDESRKVYTRNANNQGTSGYPYVVNYTEFTDNDNNWTTAEHSANKDNAALDAHWGAMMTYDYFLDKHNRNSFDDNGASIRSYVHVSTNYDNAFWNGAVMSYGDGSSNGDEGNGGFDALTSIDVAAHEIGHAVCTNTADLLYQRESGAMNEGFSDIWGAAVEHFAKGNGNDMAPDVTVWLIGDEIDRRTGSAALRSMNDPKSLRQPDTYGGQYWIDPNCAFPSYFNDYCGVHTNSGVLNYWFYLLTAGGSGTNDIGSNYNVAGIGMTKAAKIAYRLEANYLSQTSTFEDARAGSIAAATDLFGADSPEIYSVMTAWYAVGVGDLCFLDAPSNIEATNLADNGFTLTWNAIPEAASYTIETVASVDGIFTPAAVTVTTNSITFDTLEPGSEYTCTITANCSEGGDGESESITVTTTGTAPIRYCPSKGNNVSDEYIGRVQLGDIDNSSDGGDGYSNFTDISTDLAKETPNTITITPVWTGTVFSEGYGVWIDYNHDGDFDDPNETVWTKAPSRDTPVGTTFSVPEDAVLGATRMRVILRFFDTPNPCDATFSYGEVEDYTVVIKPAPDTEAPSTPSNLIVSNITQNAAKLTWTAATDNVEVTGYDVFLDGNLVGSTADTSYNFADLDARTTYRCSVKAKDAAGNISEESKEASFKTLPDAGDYCESKCTSTKLGWIDYVGLGNMSKSSGNDGGYANYTNHVATIGKDRSMLLSVSAGFPNGGNQMFFGVWIDFNHNGVFDKHEKVMSNASRESGIRSTSIAVPANAKLGKTIMRVIMRYNAEPKVGCGTFNYGEVEDYMVNIVNKTTNNTIGLTATNEKLSDISVYPNPVSNILNLRLKASNNNAKTFKVINVLGKVVKSGTLKSTQLNINNLNSGLYILEVTDGLKVFKQKFIKK